MHEQADLRPTRPGYRLQRLEIYNWGTFDSVSGTIYTAQPEGRTCLLVGQNGSGKSTLVDAILTLLVPSAIRNYNVAAGAKKTERNERSYIRGAFGHSSDSEQRTVTQYLRPQPQTYSALLAVFKDEELDRAFTVCQVLHPTTEGGVEKVYAFSDEARRLSHDLTGLSRADQVRAHLNSLGYRTTKKYSEYGQWFARRTGVRSKAMDMFNQTVAVKDIQSLNDFIRLHMLEGHDWRDKVDRLLSHFNELSTAHRELVRIRQAQEMLEPIERLGKSYLSESERMARFEQIIDASQLYFRAQTVRLYQPELESFKGRLATAQQLKDRLSKKWVQGSEESRRLKNEIEQSGGERLRLIPLCIERELTALEPKKREFVRFQQAMEICGIKALPTSQEEFAAITRRLNQSNALATAELGSLLNRQEEVAIDRVMCRQELSTAQDELDSLQRRPSNLPSYLTTLRSKICGELELPESELPFAAELISVRSDEVAWQASAEMVLRSFALSLLVPMRHYRRVRGYVEHARLHDQRGVGQRLVYLSVKPIVSKQDPGDRLHRQSLLRKLHVRPAHDLTAWVQSQLLQRFDYVCCETPEEFDAEPRLAMTANRHIKSGQDRHEKDDRPWIADPCHYILGWENHEKTKRLMQRVAELEDQVAEANRQWHGLEQRIDGLRRQLEAARSALLTNDFDLLDVNYHLRAIADLEHERHEIELSNTDIAALREKLVAIDTENALLQERRDEAVGAVSELTRSIASAEEVLHRAQRTIDESKQQGVWTRAEASFAQIDEQLISTPMTIENLVVCEQELATLAGRSLSELRKKLEPVQQQLIAQMTRYLREFKTEGEDLDARTTSLPSFLARLEHIRSEDLPCLERRFKERLNDKVSQEVALFYASLRSEGKQIEDKISQLNQALGELEYRPGTSMRLEPRPVNDREISDFQKSLRECLDDSLDKSDEANEARFLRIENLVNRLADSEKTRWRDKVIDVRRWYDFAAREVDRETLETHSFYEDSSGQSGGEKAKLAFTILVAAIAYQYDLDPAEHLPGRFAFVCVDEMFSKVDDRYAEYAMRLFEQFGLQLLIVAPLDAKARVTEPYVDCYLHVVKDESSNRSQIFTMTAREYESVVAGFESRESPNANSSQSIVSRRIRRAPK